MRIRIALAALGLCPSASGASLIVSLAERFAKPAASLSSLRKCPEPSAASFAYVSAAAANRPNPCCVRPT